MTLPAVPEGVAVGADGRALILYSDARRARGGVDDDAGERAEPAA